MAEDLQLIRRFVRSLIWRERKLLLSRIALQVLLLWVALLGVAVLSAAVGWDRATATFLMLLIAGVGVWWAAAWPLLREWRVTGDVLRQARRVEELAPDLRGRLLTAVERVDGPRGQESEAILGLVARRAAAQVSRVALHAVHPARHLARLSLVASAGLVAVSISTCAAPGGPFGVIRWWTAGTRAEAAVADLAVAAEDYAVVGDLVLRYTYPAYTGLDPKEVANSTGEVIGPPGTIVEVRARTADPVEAAGVVAYDERLEATVTGDGREIVARFSIGAAAGQYHLLLYRGGEPERSRDFAVTPQDDLPPDVMLDAASDRIEVPADGTLEFSWRARDDFGVARVELALTPVGAGVERSSEDRPGEQRSGEEREPLFVAEGRQVEAFAAERTTPRRLGLKPGDVIELRITATDNDTVSGSKRGVSQPITIVVLGAQGMDERVALREAELLELMLPVLAEHVTDPWPPGDTSGEMTVWGERLAKRYEPLLDAVRRLWAGMSTATQDGAVVRRVVDSGNKLVRYTQIAYQPGSIERPEDASFAATAELRDAAIVALEDAVLYLLRMQEMRALAEVARHAQELAKASDSLEELLAQEEPDVQEILARLDQLEQMMARLAQEAAKLSEGGLREFVNQRTSEMQRLMDEIREALAAGDVQKAREMMERLQRQLTELSQGVQDELSRRNQEGDETGSRIEDLKKELEALEEEQRQLQTEVRELRETADQRGAAEAQKLWDRLEALAREAAEDARAYRAALGEGASGPAAAFLFNEQQRADAAVGDTESTREAIEARDLRGARSAVADADSGWLYTLRAAETRRARRGEGPPPQDIEAIRAQLEQIAELLDQMEQASQTMDPSARQRAQGLEERQRQLEQRMQGAQQEAQEISQKMPVRPEGMEEALDEANQRMGEAGEDLGRGQPMQAEGSQGMAADRLREARESLDRAQQQMQQQQQQMNGAGQGQQQPSSGQPEGDQGNQPNDPLTQPEIPGREEFRTPEEYRRALLEGMEGEVPEEYRALKKRYYEDLVHQ